jgi:23S rRNA (pseudouridine1915-N3)-methyltransferase
VKAKLIAVGKIKPPFVQLDAHYRKLLSRYLPIEVVEVRNEQQLIRRLPAAGRLVALDRQGRALDSLAWSRWLGERRLEGRDLCFLIGGPDGLPPEVAARADERLSLGRQDMAHQLARAVLLEQLFRASRILAGEPYHR